MSDEVDEVALAQRRRATEVVRMAMSAAGDIDEGFSERVLAAVPRIAALLTTGTERGPIDAARWVFESSIFRAKFVKTEIEEKSQRLIVYVRAERGEQDEPLRTEPMWSPMGRMMARRVETLRPGDEILVYKWIDQIGEHPNVKKVRMLANFEIEQRVDPGDAQGREAPLRPTSTGSQPPTRRPPASEAPSPTVEERAPASPVSSDAGAAAPIPAAPASTIDQTLGSDPGGRVIAHGRTEDEDLARRMEAVELNMTGMTNRQKVAVNALARGKGIRAFASPATDAELDTILVIIREVAGETA